MYKTTKAEYILKYGFSAVPSQEKEGYPYWFSFKRISDGAVLLRGEFIYNPRSRYIETEFDLREGVRDIARMHIRNKIGKVKNVTFVCDVDKSIFALKRAKLPIPFNLENKRMSYKQVKVEKPAVEKKQYSVVCKNGVWTIERCATELLTEEEAKTLLFKKIVNGED